MIRRIYVTHRATDSRSVLYRNSWNSLKLSGKVSSVDVIDSYLIDFTDLELDVETTASLFTNEALEQFSIDELFSRNLKSKFILEIGYLPGVTDNVGATAREAIIDRFNLDKNIGIKVYTSKVYAVSGTLTKGDAEKIAGSLYNPLIERGLIFTGKQISKKKGLPNTAPEVALPYRIPVMNVSLEVSDEDLVKIGQEGIMDETGKRRGPLALDLDSMKTIQEYFRSLGRNPKDIELESLAQTWSEHCKHTIFASEIDGYKQGLYKTFIKGATKEIRKKKGRRDFCISVFSDNAGGIDFDENYMITHKVETHNSPSALDPFGGAITGIVGVNRDTIGFGLGAKPVANTYGFCFGNPEDEKALYKNKGKKNKMLPPKRILEGVVHGVNVGGNCSGIPTVSGFVKYDDRFKGKPLVFVGTVGLIPKKINGKPSHQKKARAGDYIVMLGGRVGRDGIHGATFSSVEMDSKSPATAVQIGDPITQKKLSDAIVKEARTMDLYSSITDNGAGGLSCSVAEMAKECGGARVDLEKVPLKYPGLLPWEIWISESQERMTLSVPKKKWEVFRRLMDSRGVEATVIGEFTSSPRCVVRYHSELVMDMDMDFLHDGLPKKKLVTKQPVKNLKNPNLPKGDDRTKIFEELIADKNLSSFGFISQQYDHEVQASSVLKPLSGAGMINTDAQVFQPVLDSKKGVVLSASLYPSYSDISTYDMTANAIDTAIRNTITAGGKMNHLAILDNFCWCSSNDEERLYELKESARACYEYATAYGAPFISGKDSMFNDFRGYDEKGNKVNISIPPTLLISSISVMSDLSKTVSPEFKVAGDLIYLLGETNDELGASEYYKLLAQKSGNQNLGVDTPKVDPRKNLRTYHTLEDAIEKGLIASAISVSSGGLAIALAKASIGGGLGAKVNLDEMTGEAQNIDAKLFSESSGRVLVTVPKQKVRAFEKITDRIQITKIGQVEKDNKFIVTNEGKKVINTTVPKLKKLYHEYSEKMK